MAVTEDTFGIKEGKAEGTGVKDGLEEDGDAELADLYFETVKDVGVCGV